MNTLLVIGNGFDLTAGARTQYNNYFNSKFFEDTKAKCFDWIKKTSINGDFEPVGIGNMLDYNFNCWALLFCLESQENNIEKTINWCDIEKIIHDSLTSKVSATDFSWEHVFNILHCQMYSNNQSQNRNTHFMKPNIKTQIMLYYLANKNWGDYLKNKSGFYEKLLEELKAFEHAFGFYIQEETRSNQYIDCAHNLVDRLVDHEEKDILQIDSFNYSDFSTSRINIRHINGDCSDPIFGIELIDEEEQKFPDIRRFTKTMRRVYQDSHNLNQDSTWCNEPFNEVVVFGHSLNEMDYDYFNYLFTTLKFNTFSVGEMGSVTFVYKIYNLEKQDEIRNEIADNIYKLLSYYEAYVSKSNQHILINLLRFSGKLKIREI